VLVLHALPVSIKVALVLRNCGLTVSLNTLLERYSLYKLPRDGILDNFKAVLFLRGNSSKQVNKEEYQLYR